MAEKDSPILLLNALADPKEYLKVLLQEDVPVVCINKGAQKSRILPFKALYDNNNSFWLQKGAWEFSFTGEVFADIKAKAEALKSSGEIRLSPPPAPAEPAPVPKAAPAEPVPPGFGKEYDAITAMPEAERLRLTLEDKRRLDGLIAQRPRQEAMITSALVDTTRDTALVNQVTLMDAMHLADDEAKKHTQSLVDSTCAIVKSSAQLITANIFNDELMNTLVAKSNGTIIQHMTRVYLNGIAFLSYYNSLVSTSSVINKLRISFDKKYRDYYLPLLPHLEPEALTMERVFLGGMRAIPDELYFNWATGFLIHDIGKAAAVEYHEGEAAYNRDIVVEHVKLGYNSVMHKTNYPREAGLITGYHHEYYGDPAGYGYFRAYLEQYKKAKPYARQDYCISYDIEPMVDYHALGYFPAKVLEIIDIFDSVTDPNRRYRKPLSPEEALSMIRKEFIEEHHKIDPVLFDIFEAFAREREAAAKK